VLQRDPAAPVPVCNHDVIDSDCHDRSADVRAVDNFDVETFDSVLGHEEAIPDRAPALCRYARRVLFGPQRLVHLEPEPPAQSAQIRMGTQRALLVFASVITCSVITCSVITCSSSATISGTVFLTVFEWPIAERIHGSPLRFPCR
jgi:hypothetical protein